MSDESLPYDDLTAKQKEALFNEAVEKRYSKLILDLDNLDKFDREIRINKQYNELYPVFEESHHIKLSRIERLPKLNEPIESDEKDKYFQVKYFYNRKSSGKSYDLRNINYHDIELLLKAYQKGSEYYLENQIWTEVFYQYYKYIKQVKDPDKANRKSSPENRYSLTNPEKILLLVLLQEIGQFPGFSADVDDKAIIGLMSEIIGSNYEADKISKKNAYKTLRGNITSNQKPTKLKSLNKILEISRKIQNQKLEDLIVELIENIKGNPDS